MPLVLIADLVDLDRYPVHDLGSAANRDLVSACRASLGERGAVKLDGFIRPDAVAAMARQAAALAPLGHPNDETHKLLAPARSTGTSTTFIRGK